MTATSVPGAVVGLSLPDASRPPPAWSQGETTFDHGGTVVELQSVAPDTLVISFHGLANHGLAPAVVDRLSTMTPPDHLIADLTGLILVDPGPVEALVSGLHSVLGVDGRVCLVCSRLTGRRLLRRWGVDGGGAGEIAIFSSARDALQARVQVAERLWRRGAGAHR